MLRLSANDCVTRTCKALRTTRPSLLKNIQKKKNFKSFLPAVIDFLPGSFRAPVFKMASAYEYNRLPTAPSIRLFTLQPGSSEAPIEGNLTTILLSDKTATTINFKALSYTWANPLDEGNPSYKPNDVVPRSILCGGRDMAVTENLHDSLCQLRERKEVSPLWIDAICISQTDKGEVPYQLKLMSRIYAEASLVIIWLGNEDPTTPEAIQTMEKTLSVGAKSNFDNEVISMTVKEQHAVANFLLRSWFGRLWAMQEVLLPINALCLCGSREVDIAIPAIFASSILQTNRTIFKNTRPGQVEVSIRRLGAAASVAAWAGCTYPAGGFSERAFLRYHQIDYKLTVPRTYKWLVRLELLIHEARQRECSNPKDRVLAPLAFAMHETFLPEVENFTTLDREIHRILSAC
jgi:hypothetical protein